jgi:glutathionyl-hydroquinone reductase
MTNGNIIIDVSYVHPHMLENGWKFSIPGGQVPSEDFPQATEDKLFGSKYMKEIYFKADPGESFFFLYCFPSVLELVRGSCGLVERWRG